MIRTLVLHPTRSGSRRKKIRLPENYTLCRQFTAPFGDGLRSFPDTGVELFLDRVEEVVHIRGR